MSRSFNRRSFLAQSVAASAVVATTHRVTAGQATPMASPVAETARQWLAVADPAAASIEVYDLVQQRLIETVPDIAVNAHAGFLPLNDGSLLFMDDLGKQLVHLSVHGDHLHLELTPVDGTTFSHLAVNGPAGRIVGVGSDAAEAPITLVDLETAKATPVAIPDAGEVGVFLTESTLFHRNDVLNQVEAYPIETVLAGTVEPVSTVQIGAGGHGEAITRAGDVIFSATDEGIEELAWDGSALSFVTVHPWHVDASGTGRGFFQRLSLDQSAIVTYTADRSAAETAWDTWQNHALVIDRESGKAIETDLGNGYVFRFGLAPSLALFARIGGEGDEAVAVDLASGDIAFRIPLPTMSRGPKPGSSIYETNQYRAVAVTPDGSRGFVTQGGDGLIQVIDLATGQIESEIATASPLDGGGHLVVFGDGAALDTVAR